MCKGGGDALPPYAGLNGCMPATFNRYKIPLHNPHFPTLSLHKYRNYFEDCNYIFLFFHRPRTY